MLTIQPNFSQRIHSGQAFGSQSAIILVPKENNIPSIEDKKLMAKSSRRYEDEFERDIVDVDYEEVFGDENPAETTALAVIPKENQKDTHHDTDLNDIKNNINATMDNLKDVQKELPAGAQKIMNGFFTVGAAAVSGISVKYGFNETNKILGKLFNKPSMKKFGENFVKPFKALWKGIKTFFKDEYKNFKTTDLFKNMKKSFENFKKTSFGKKLVKLYEKFVKSGPVQETKDFINKVRDVKPSQVKEATGDVLGLATGVSTGIAANLEPEKVKESI